MGNDLLERDDALRDLHTALAGARDGRGCVAVVSGEAGAGKTTLVREFVDRAAGSPRVLIGGCDPLAAPRPLGPLIDATATLDPAASRRLATGLGRAQAFALALDVLDSASADGHCCVFVVEDVHWADEATLDLVTFLGRRLPGRRVLLVLTYRDDEVDAEHPLRARLGELSSAIAARVRLSGLSVDAVAALAEGTALDPVGLHQATGGNAFYVTEVLASGSEDIPESVRDAVLSRASRLDPDARAVLDAASIVPGRVERWLLDAIRGAAPEAGLDRCVQRGLLAADSEGAIAFRHELARHAVNDAILPARRRALHEAVVAALRALPPDDLDHARLTHHAAEAGDGPTVVTHGPIAAAEAAAAGAHREAVRHLAMVLRFEQLMDERRRAQIYATYASELNAIARASESIPVYDKAVELYLAAGDVDAAAETLARSGSPLTTLGRSGESHERVGRAVALIEGRPPSPAAATIVELQCSDAMLARQFEAAERYGQLAMSLAEQVGNETALAETCIQSGIALSMSGDDAGLARIRRGIAIGERLGLDRVVALGYLQIGSGYGELRRYDVAVPALQTCIEHAAAREHVASMLYTTAWLARCELELGHWDDAGRIADDLLRHPRGVGISRFVALLTVGWLRARRGDPDVAAVLDEALELARSTRHLQRLWPVAACRAEVAWLHDRIDGERDLVDEALSVARSIDYPLAIEELAYWQAFAGEQDVTVATNRTPFSAAVNGRHDVAAARWDELGCPYEAAMARSLTGDAEQLRRAHTTFDRLGAGPMRARTAAALRDIGAPVPRGPYGAARRNPYSLTDRELEVLAMLGTGATDRQIGESLHISTKTASHHVSRLLGKLQVRSRAEAAVEAVRMGLVEPRSGP